MKNKIFHYLLLINTLLFFKVSEFVSKILFKGVFYTRKSKIRNDFRIKYLQVLQKNFSSETP